MSYAENPGSNPYAAPTSDIEPVALVQTSGYVGYAGFWRRFAAYFLDNILIAIVQYAIIIPASLVLESSGVDSTSRGIVMFGIIILYYIGVIAYYAGMESSESQATFGKKAMGIKVTDLYGRRISFGRAIGRFFAKIVSYITLYIGFFMAGFTEKKQALHDMMAGTLVLKTR